MSPRTASPSLRIATACALLPMGLGSLAFLGWLLTTGGLSTGGEAFVRLGIGTLIGGLALFPTGLVVLGLAARRGPPRKALLGRLLLLLVNVPLAFGYLQGLGVAAIQRVEIVNRSSVPVEQLTLFACGRRARRDVGGLAPGARHVWRFSPPSEGTLEFQGEQDGRPIGGSDLAMFFVFDRKDVLLTVDHGGEWTVQETPGAPWSWVPGR